MLFLPNIWGWYDFPKVNACGPEQKSVIFIEMAWINPSNKSCPCEYFPHRFFLKNGLENKRIGTLSPKRIHVMKNALPFRKKPWNVRWGNLGIKTLRAGNTIFWTLSREIYPKRTRPRFKRSGWLEKSRCTW